MTEDFSSLSLSSKLEIILGTNEDGAVNFDMFDDKVLSLTYDFVIKLEVLI